MEFSHAGFCRKRQLCLLAAFPGIVLFVIGRIAE